MSYLYCEKCSVKKRSWLDSGTFEPNEFARWISGKVLRQPLICDSCNSCIIRGDFAAHVTYLRTDLQDRSSHAGYFIKGTVKIEIISENNEKLKGIKCIDFDGPILSKLAKTPGISMARMLPQENACCSMDSNCKRDCRLKGVDATTGDSSKSWRPLEDRELPEISFPEL